MLEPKLLSAGWKPVSLVDVKGKTTFTLWLCGCNLRCPFCHNWRLATADPETCKNVPVKAIVEAVKSVKYLIDYVHVTGGEPLVQVNALLKLFIRLKRIGVKISLNTNMTLPDQLIKVIKYVDHIATDMKIPWLMYGVQRWEPLYRNFLRSIRIISEKNKTLELRIPVIKAPLNTYIKIYKDIINAMKPSYTNYYIVYNRIVGPPLTNPRNPEWCKHYCLSEEEYQQYVEHLKRNIETQQAIQQTPIHH